MIIVNLKHDPFRRNNYYAEPHFLNAGFVNWRVTVRPHQWRPPTDVFETENIYTVRVEVAGMSESDFIISIDGNILTISGVRPDPSSERRAYHQMEISYGEFATQIELPTNIDHGSVEAEYSEGFLRVTLPKSQPKQIYIKE